MIIMSGMEQWPNRILGERARLKVQRSSERRDSKQMRATLAWLANYGDTSKTRGRTKSLSETSYLLVNSLNQRRPHQSSQVTRWVSPGSGRVGSSLDGQLWAVYPGLPIQDSDNEQEYVVVSTCFVRPQHAALIHGLINHYSRLPLDVKS